MSPWSASIDGNDVAQSLKVEYSVLFSKYDVETAVTKLDEYVNANFDEYDYKSYVYSVAKFMWTHGILTAEMKCRALQLIAADDMFEYEAIGKRIFRERQKVLVKLKETLCSPQPPKKKIRTEINPNRFLEIGDVVSLKLLSTNEYILVQKIYDETRAGSVIEEDMKNIFPHFLLLNYRSTSEPTTEDAINSAPTTYIEKSYKYFLRRHKLQVKDVDKVKNYVFFCKGKPREFAKRHYKVLCNLPTKIQYVPKKRFPPFYVVWRKNETELHEATRTMFADEYARRFVSNLDGMWHLYYTGNKEIVDAFNKVKANTQMSDYEVMMYLIKTTYGNDKLKLQ